MRFKQYSFLCLFLIVLFTPIKSDQIQAQNLERELEGLFFYDNYSLIKKGDNQIRLQSQAAIIVKKLVEEIGDPVL